MQVKGGEFGSNEEGGDGGTEMVGVVGVGVDGGCTTTGVGVVGVVVGGEWWYPPPPVPFGGDGLVLWWCPPLGGFPQFAGGEPWLCEGGVPWL